MKPGRKRTSSFQKAATFEQELFENRRIKSEQADVLISLWSWGKISAAHVQEVAQAALKDAQMHTADFNIYDWEVLSKLGSGGHKKQSIARDLGKKLPPALCQISDHRIPVKVAVSKGISRVAQVSIPFILPGEIWKSAWAHRHVWRQHICNCEDSIVEFWSQCGNHPALQRHPSNLFLDTTVVQFPSYSMATEQVLPNSLGVQPRAVCLSLGDPCWFQTTVS